MNKYRIRYVYDIEYTTLLVYANNDGRKPMIKKSKIRATVHNEQYGKYNLEFRQIHVHY